MIANFQELLVLLDCCKRQSSNIKKEIEYAFRRSDIKKINQLETKERLIQEKSLAYIAFYKDKIADSYLENRLYGYYLNELEKQYQSLLY